MESLPIDIEQKLENLPVISFDDTEKLQSGPACGQHFNTFSRWTARWKITSRQLFSGATVTVADFFFTVAVP